MRDPYEVLGLSRSCSPSEVQQAYRKLAKAYHPDRNIGDPDSESKFRDVQDAYDILNDPAKRGRYDTFGPSGFKAEPGFDFSGTMGDIFGRSSFKGRNIQARVEVSLEEIAAGCSKKVSYTRGKSCSSCAGTGAKSHSSCGSCDGKGFKNMRVQLNFNLQMTCAECHGTGKRTSEHCQDCGGSGTCGSESVERDVYVPAGANDGVIRLPGQGEPCKTGKGAPGDLLVHVSVKRHELFQRHEQHLVMDVPCTFVQLCRGFDLEVPTLYGHSVVVRIPQATMPNSQIRVAGKGLPGGKTGLGDMFIIPKLDMPKEISEEYGSLLDKMFELDAKSASKRRNEWSEKIQRYKKGV